MTKKYPIVFLSLLLLAAVLRAEEISRVTPVVRAYRKTRNAVVNISSTKLIQTRWGGFGRDIFGDVFPELMPGQRKVNSLGSGVVISPYGYIVTNAHVVKRAQEITVQFADGSSYEANTVVMDSSTDLAIIKLGKSSGDGSKNATKQPFPFLRLGRSDDLMVGETVIAVGNPMGFSSTVTTGIVSATNRKLEFRQGVSYTGLIQTDAPINPGNSGGPLLNIKGELIGINTAIRADAQNIGFAIGVNTLAAKLPELLDIENLTRVEFGIKVLQTHDKIGTRVRVSSVRENSPGHRARLRAGDLVKSINGKDVSEVSDFVFEMLEARVPGKVKIICERGGRKMLFDVSITRRPMPDGGKLARSMFGVQLREITPALARSMRLATTRGLLVIGVEEGSPAERLGVQLKDVLFQAAGVYVNSLESLGLILEKIPAGELTRIGILRGRSAAVVPIRARKPQADVPDRGKGV